MINNDQAWSIELDTQKCFDKRKEYEAKLSVSNIFLSVSKHLEVSKTHRPRLRSLSIVFRTWFTTARSTEF